MLWVAITMGKRKFENFLILSAVSAVHVTGSHAQNTTAAASVREGRSENSIL